MMLCSSYLIWELSGQLQGCTNYGAGDLVQMFSNSR
jgi:hypothetical protein